MYFLVSKPHQNEKLLIPKLNMLKKTTSSFAGQTHVIGSRMSIVLTLCAATDRKNGLCSIYILSFFKVMFLGLFLILLLSHCFKWS